MGKKDKTKKNKRKVVKPFKHPDVQMWVPGNMEAAVRDFIAEHGDTSTKKVKAKQIKWPKYVMTPDELDSLLRDAKDFLKLMRSHEKVYRKLADMRDSGKYEGDQAREIEERAEGYGAIMDHVRNESEGLGY